MSCGSCDWSSCRKHRKMEIIVIIIVPGYIIIVITWSFIAHHMEVPAIPYAMDLCVGMASGRLSMRRRWRWMFYATRRSERKIAATLNNNCILFWLLSHSSNLLTCTNNYWGVGRQLWPQNGNERGKFHSEWIAVGLLSMVDGVE